MAIDEALQVRDALSQSTASGDAIVAVYKDAVASLEARVAGAAPAAAAKRRKPRKPRGAWGAHPPMLWFCDMVSVFYTMHCVFVHCTIALTKVMYIQGLLH